MFLPFSLLSPLKPEMATSLPRENKGKKDMELELELGLKITQTREDLSSYTLFKKDGSNNPPFKSTETDTAFLLTAYLSGFKKDQMKIQIDRTGTKIAISGTKWIQEMVMVSWQMRKKDPQIRRFRRVFRIPDVIVLDQIKARFDELESILTIFMPKSKKGILGIQIEDISEEEEEEEQESDRTSTEREPIAEDGNEHIPRVPVQEHVKDGEILEEPEEPKMEDREETEQLGKTQETFETEPEKESEEEMSNLEVPSLGKVELPVPHGPITPDISRGIETPGIQDSMEVGEIHQTKAAAGPKLLEENQNIHDMEEPQRPEIETEKKVEEHEEKEHDHVLGAESLESASETLHPNEAESNVKETSIVASQQQTLDGKAGIPKAETEIEEAAAGEKGGKALEEVEDEKPDSETTRTTNNEGAKSRRSSRRCCKPLCLVTGSAVVISLVVVVIHLLKNKRNQQVIREKRG